MKLRFERRPEVGPWTEAAVLAGAVLLAGLCGCALFAAAGADPVEALGVLLREPFASRFGFSETLVKTVPLGFCALAVALALKIDLWNIGAEGQLCVGALAASALALADPPLPGSLALPALLAAGALAGAAWAVIAGLLKVCLNVSEILSTLMLNYVALAWVELMVFGPWKGADGFPYTALFAEPWRLPQLGGRVHAGLPLLIGLALVLWWVERRTVLGYEVRVVGASPATARYGGLPVLRRLLLVIGAAGGAAGLAGACVVSGVEYRLHAGISPGYGYTGIIVAFLARRSLPGAVLVAFLFAALAVGGEGLQMACPGLSASTVQVFWGLLLLLVLSGGALARWRPVRSR